MNIDGQSPGEEGIAMSNNDILSPDVSNRVEALIHDKGQRPKDIKARAGFRTGLKLFFLIISILLVDFLSKGLINFYIQPVELAPNFFPFGGLSVFQGFYGIDFCIHHVTNRGAAWGIGSGEQDLLLFLRIAVVIGLIVYLRLSSKAREYRYSLALIVAGGLGNIVDYFIYGHVIDMFHLFFWGYSYPVFNIADASICLGITWMLLQSFQRKKDVIPQT